MKIILIKWLILAAAMLTAGILYLLSCLAFGLHSTLESHTTKLCNWIDNRLA